MTEFKRKLEQAAAQAANLPSYPQADKTYNINAKDPDFSAHDEYVRKERFGRMQEVKQTVYHINTKEGKLRISPNQMQQLNELLENVTIAPAQEWVTVVTVKGENGTEFELAE